MHLCNNHFMSNTSAQRTPKYLEVQGPKEAAANRLADLGYRILEVVGTNGHDSKNETADEYIVKVERHTGFRKDTNLRILTAYHAGDRSLYLEDLRNDTKMALRDYAVEKTGRPSFVLGFEIDAAIKAVLNTIDNVGNGVNG